MIRHYLKLIWNRKRSNLLITAEIFMSFLVVFAVVVLATHYADNYRRPLGFAFRDVWNVSVNTRSGGMESTEPKIPPEVIETYRQLLTAVRELPEVEAVAGAASPPYGHSRWIYGSDLGNWRLRYSVNQVTDGFQSVMGLEVTKGRWFDGRDDGAAWVPVVLNERLAHEIFGGRNPIGNAVPQEKRRDGTMDPEMRIVGVVREFRQDGETQSPENYVFRRHRLDDAEREPPSNVLIRLRPGTTAAFEEKLVARMQAAARDWSFEVEPLDQMRESFLNETLAPIIGAGVIAGFLMLMVAMGLTGVLWQTVTQRTREVGLRRAKGATVIDIRRQILGELVVMTSAAVLAGSVIVVQFPLLQLMNFVSGAVFTTSLVVSAACIYLLTVACAWYPSRLATRIQPAEALHYE